MIRASKLTQIQGPPKYFRIWRKRQIWRLWRNFDKIVDEMISANKLTQLQGLPKCLRIWRKRQIWRSWRNFAKIVDELIRANKLTQLRGPRNGGEFGKNGVFGDYGEISPSLCTK